MIIELTFIYLFPKNSINNKCNLCRSQSSNVQEHKILVSNASNRLK